MPTSKTPKTSKPNKVGPGLKKAPKDLEILTRLEPNIGTDFKAVQPGKSTASSRPKNYI